MLNPDLTVEAGFMKSIATATCEVTQLGVDLKVDDGTVVSPAGPQTTWEVTNAVVTFNGIGSDAVSLKGVMATPLKTASAPAAPPPSASSAAAALAAAAQGPKGGMQPAPRAGDDDWEDLFWVPHTRLSYMNRGIDPSWRTNAVTGRVVLAGGMLSAGMPSDGAAVNGLWELRSKVRSCLFL